MLNVLKNYAYFLFVKCTDYGYPTSPVNIYVLLLSTVMVTKYHPKGEGGVLSDQKSNPKKQSYCINVLLLGITHFLSGGVFEHNFRTKSESTHIYFYFILFHSLRNINEICRGGGGSRYWLISIFWYANKIQNAPPPFFPREIFDAWVCRAAGIDK